MTTDGPYQPPDAPPNRPGVDPVRPFDRVDLAVIAGATGISLALAWYAWTHRWRPVDIGWTFYPPPSVMALLLDSNRTDALMEIAGTGLVVASFTLVALRLRQPRPGLRRVFRQPGFAAVLGASIASGVAFSRDGIAGALLMLQASMSEPALAGDPFPTYRFKAFPGETILAGFVAVLAAWLVLKWDGRWRAERSWIDRSGRLVGWAWLVLLPLGQLFIRVMSFYD